VELYDPATGTWTATGSLTTAREDHTATLLPNGQVLVAGGISTGNAETSNAELYNPATGTWTATGSLSQARGGHTATLLLNGGVLVVGGIDPNDSALASVELFTPPMPIQGTYQGTFTVGSVVHSMTMHLTQSGTTLTGTATIFGPWASTFTVSGTVGSQDDGLTMQATNTDGFGITFFGGIHGPGHLSGIASAPNANGSWSLNQG
jgi:hypothetical protein